MTALDDKWLRRTCRKWQKRLGLLDWKISVVFCPVSDLSEGSSANISWEPDDMSTAQMWVADPSEVERDNVAWFTESNMIHELIHLRFYGHLPVPEYNVNEERAINAITLALFPERRGGK